MTLLKLDVVFARLESGTELSIVAVLDKYSISFIYQSLLTISIAVSIGDNTL